MWMIFQLIQEEKGHKRFYVPGFRDTILDLQNFVVKLDWSKLNHYTIW